MQVRECAGECVGESVRASPDLRASLGAGFGWTALRLWYVLRYHRASQLSRRLVSLARKRSVRLTGSRRYARAPEVDVEPRSDAGFARLATRKMSQRIAAKSRASAEELRQGRYQFLNVARSLPDPIDWRLACWPEAPHLWRFHLHYHEFLLDLAAEGRRSGKPKWLHRAWDVVTQWIQSNPLGQVNYFAAGSRSFPKERLEVFSEGRVFRIDNFKRLEGFGGGAGRGKRCWTQDKGHDEEFRRFIDAVRTGGESPIAFESLVNTAEATLAAVESFEDGRIVELSSHRESVRASPDLQAGEKHAA